MGLNKRVLGIISLLVLTLGYVGYGYSQFQDIINPQKSGIVRQYVVIQYPNSSFLVLSSIEYVNLTLGGWEPPAGSKAYLINMRSYVTGIPEIDLNMSLQLRYEKFTIIVGSSEVKKCSSNPEEFYGSCEDRALAVSEVTVLVSSLFKRYYYWEAIKRGLNNESAKMYAYKETMNRKSIRYLSFLAKAEIGLGKLGNKENLCIVILGPAEGSEKNEIIIPRRGLIILKGKSDAALRAEAILMEHITGFRLS
ncbi:hypothetical protein [Pyrococcus abyssi]|uniref:Uncharacterized protein n=1 Tax=Pyrococcus abyssi (strain GE5 / Orsay) TaxID=272844 RepID=Q9V0N4_PYRAB|nr:hypothetical protein [Pyrococcus abyssi]CAB49669.1 Hypothetical protein PAB1862 [Pyrococcus abyssi GE5]CCE70151.1 TPA: hypothetical protein PAB1862 [Pyrococcus abyssi GE5]